MTPVNVFHAAKRVVHDNSPAILTALGVSGVVSTAYLASKATWDAAMDAVEDDDGYIISPRRDTRIFIKVHGKRYIPAAVSGVLSIGAMIAATRTGSKRAAAAYSLLSVSESALMEYRDKVVEKLGDNKERAIRDEIAQDRVNKTPPSSVIIAGAGNVLCCEQYTMRYFECDMETLKKAVNDVNAKILRTDRASLSDFYDCIGVQETSESDELGWNSPELLELEFTTVMSPDQRPCIAFNYKHIRLF